MKIFKILVGIILAGAILTGGFMLWIADKYVVPIVMYHNVEPLDHHEANWVSPENFERQMAYLKDHHYQVISFEELIDGIQAGRKFNRKTVVITFDDGYQNNYTYAYPILKKYDFPATIFVIAGTLLDETEQDLVEEFGDIRGGNWLTLDQVREMADNNITIGSHTVTGAYLFAHEPAMRKRQIFESKRILERKINRPVDYLAYPIGGFDEEIKSWLKTAGYRAACTTNRGNDRFNQDVFEINRIRFSNRQDSGIEIWIKLSGYYNLFRKLKNPN